MPFLKRAVKLLVSLIVFCFDSVIRICRKMLGMRCPTRCVVLYYHVVRQEERTRFARQLDEIFRLAKPIWADRPDMIGDWPHYAAITFDDGFRSFRDNALPELVQREIFPPIFLCRQATWASPCLAD